jgi:predicted 2-oxoglutarate/Fe(II)-dependent dioxygenase YbiX
VLQERKSRAAARNQFKEAKRISGMRRWPAGLCATSLERLMTRYLNLRPGDPAPWFSQRANDGDGYSIDRAGGRYIVLLFLGSATAAASSSALDAVLRRPDLFDGSFASCFAVSVDPADERYGRLRHQLPGLFAIWDVDMTASALYGAAPVEPDPQNIRFLPRWIILDPTLRVMKVIPIERGTSDHSEAIDFVAGLPPVDRFAGMALQAPIIVLPNVFERALCENLIALYDQSGGEDSGIATERNGRTIVVTDHTKKRRRDHTVTDEKILSLVRGRIVRRVVPEIQKVHQFLVTRIERYIVACYAAEDKAHFAAHRDNTNKGSAHRRFALSINLNDDFDGGEVSFPEYGLRSFKAPAGGAVVFSCSLLHAVSEVRRGRRYAFLPFLYDEAAAAIREENLKYLGE